MLIVKKMIYGFSVLFLCSAFILGCSDNKEQKPTKKTEMLQGTAGKEMVPEIKKPIEDAVKLKNQVEDTQKKKLEGC
jgi:hypothetical protein